MSGLPGNKGARKPSGLLCSSHTLEHRYHDEMTKPERRSWRKLAKRREEKIWRAEVDEDLSYESAEEETYITKHEIKTRIADYLFRHYEVHAIKHSTEVLPNSLELVEMEGVDDGEIHLTYTVARKQGGRTFTNTRVYDLDDLLEMFCDD